MFKALDLPIECTEADVRERLVTPLLSELGYLPEEIIREKCVTIGASKVVYSDYVIETVSENDYLLPSNRIVVEVKRPGVDLSVKVLDQAMSYAKHRLIDASYVVTTNGHRLQAFDVFSSTSSEPNRVLDIQISNIQNEWTRISETIGAATIRKYFAGTEVIEEIGAGGFGRVFKARHLKLNRIEALKVLNPSIEPRSTLERRFKRGARGLAMSKHPYICEIYDVGVYRGRPYYRLDLINGQNAIEFVVRENLPTLDRVAIFEQICEAISHAHDQGVYHCDLKPANILVTELGTPKVIDFDLCHIGANTSTAISQIGATVAYMDRTIWNEPSNRDCLADIYSLGLVLWSLITGVELSANWTSDELYKELMDRDSQYGERLGQVIFRCITSTRKQRPQSVTELRRFLKIENWRSQVSNLVDSAVGPLAANDPKMAYELRFHLWKQGGSFPGNTDFVSMTAGLPATPSSQEEREFIFRCACEHWRKPIRHIFSKWTTDDLVLAAEKVVSDKSLDYANKGAVAQSHPARKALEILAVTDEYRSPKESEKVAQFYLDILRSGRKKLLFHTILDDLARLSCFKNKDSRWRRDVSIELIGLIRDRLPSLHKGSKKEIGKLLEKLSPDKCGEDSESVAKFVAEVATYPVLLHNSVMLLACMRSAYASDALVKILDELKDNDLAEFKWALPWAVGISGKRRRESVVNYLKELESSLDPNQATLIRSVLHKLDISKRGSKRSGN
ncbi:MAG: protein kinase [Acidobacteriota bacterium]|nr:MAG: protein kinase [Acidobacteriota bacterium]